ncbi:MAG: radical SAM protein [Flavobacteriaceae bacterium]|nr:radical SAM protein [Flavobacteriaceae bacterium]
MKRISLTYPKAVSATPEVLTHVADTTLKARPDIISGWRKTWVHLKLRWTLVRVMMRCYRNPLDWIRGLWYLVKLRRSFMGNNRVQKMIRVGQYYYMGLHIPGWNDATYQKYVAKTLLSFKPHQQPVANYEMVYLAITKKCPLQCDHCSAWDTLNEKDELEATDFEKLIYQLREEGVFQINFTGGEPLVKFDLLERLVRGLPSDIKAWVNTSGYRLTRDKALKLKEAGLTGLAISLDHYKEEKHNAFRNFNEAYYWAMEAAKNALEVGLVVAFTVCLSEELCWEEELMQYLTLARNSGGHFVQLLEPRAVGHYGGKNIGLSKEAIARTEAFFLKMNFGKEHLDYPHISYHGYYQRRNGCMSAGKKALYIDADGHLNACPFCLKSYGNVLEGGMKEKVKAMAENGCAASF